MQKLESMVHPGVVSMLVNIDLTKRRGPDKRFWAFEENGAYTVKSGYRLLIGLFDSHHSKASTNESKWWKKFWLLKVLPKVRIFGWRVFHGFVLVDLQLRRHHIPIFGICAWCKHDWGSVEHSLLYCEVIKSVWKRTQFWWSLKECKGRDIQEIMLFLWWKIEREDFEEWLILAWMIWRELCRAKHEERPVLGLKLGVGAKRFTRQLGDRCWKPPPFGDFRVDVDPLFNPKLDRYDVGVIVRDDVGTIKMAWAKPIGKLNSILQAELVAMLYGVGVCLQHNFCPMHIFTDSLLLVRALKNDDMDGGALQTDLDVILDLYSQGLVASIIHCSRSAVQCAHELALFSGTLSEARLWTDNFLEWLARFAANDF